jgi:hypothetical protein
MNETQKSEWVKPIIISQQINITQHLDIGSTTDGDFISSPYS